MLIWWLIFIGLADEEAYSVKDDWNSLRGRFKWHAPMRRTSFRRAMVEFLSGAHESPMLGSRLQETYMVADSNSQIAWHRAQIRKLRETLKHLETARFSFGEIGGSKTIDQTQKNVAELKRKIRESEQIIAAYEKQTRRPLTTDYQTLANVPWSNWNARGSSNA
jgi:hypothetical protein